MSFLARQQERIEACKKVIGCLLHYHHSHPLGLGHPCGLEMHDNPGRILRAADESLRSQQFIATASRYPRLQGRSELTAWVVRLLNIHSGACAARAELWALESAGLTLCVKLNSLGRSTEVPALIEARRVALQRILDQATDSGLFEEGCFERTAEETIAPAPIVMPALVSSDAECRRIYGTDRESILAIFRSLNESAHLSTKVDGALFFLGNSALQNVHRLRSVAQELEAGVDICPEDPDDGMGKIESAIEAADGLTDLARYLAGVFRQIEPFGQATTGDVAEAIELLAK